MEKIVKGATKIKLAAPKSKYIEPILQATNSGEVGVADVFRTLQLRLRDSTWTIVFKSLIVVHLMIHEGSADVTLRFIAESPKRLAISVFTDVQTQGSNIRHYSEYLLERVRGYRDTKQDFVRSGSGRLKRLSVDKGLLRETEAVQSQIKALIKCDVLSTSEPDNEISLTTFRLLTMDLLELFRVMNEGTINVLEHYFEMSRTDAERALRIYKTFSRQTDQVVQYLALARQYENATRLEVPKLKHAPTTLTSSLEEYLNDPDFEVNRRQYLAQQQAKQSGKPMPPSQPSAAPALPPKNTVTTSTSAAKAPSSPTKGPAPDLIDFFESIEQNQQPMAHGPLPPQGPAGGNFAQAYPQASANGQQAGYNPFLQQNATVPSQTVQPNFTGTGFGGYAPPQQLPQHQTYSFTPQLASIPQNGVAAFQPQAQPPFQSQSPPLQPQYTSTNPFRQSMVQASPPTATSPISAGLRRQSTNPFARNIAATQQAPPSQNFFDQNGSSFSQPKQQQDLQFNANPFSPQTQGPDFQSPIQPQRTSTNPFAKTLSPPPMSTTSASPIVASPTGSTNPFRQSAFVNQQTGQGWQHGNQGTLFGVDVRNVETQPVFPRPG